MKKFCLLTILIVLVVFAIVPGIALADTSEPTHVASIDVRTETHMYRASSLFTGGKSVGMRLYGYYFGNSDIPVTVEIYSDDNYDFNFYLGDRNFDDADDSSQFAKLTAEQTQTKLFVLDLFAQIDAFVERIDRLVNTQLETSDIYAYNNAKEGDKIAISEDTYRILQLAQTMYVETSGAFNPAAYRLVDLWGFSSRIYSNGNFGLPYDRPVTSEVFWKQGYPLPNEKYVKAFATSAFTDFSDSAVTLTQEGDKFYVTKNVAPAVVDGVEYQQWLDLGGVAKGYVVDCIKSMLTKCNIGRYYVDAGSSSTAYGSSFDGGTFSVGYQNPYSIFKNLLGLDVSNCLFSVSGQYLRKYTVDGVEYSHIINCATGAPAQTGLKSVLIIIPDGNQMWASMGDCLTTALTVMGRDKLIDFANSYLAKNGIKIVTVYETLEGKREILSNMNLDEFNYLSDDLADFAWALEKHGDEFVYNAEAPNFDVQQNGYKTTIIVLACVVGVLLVGVIVYQFVRGKKPLKNVQAARRDKPFKIADIVPYMAVVLVIIVLFVAVFTEEKTSWNKLSVVDSETGETLFVYYAARNEYVVNTQNSRNWRVTVENTDKGFLVTFTRDFDGTERFNQLEITQSVTATAKMVDSICGFHKDCVRNFDEIDVSGGVIVCSPNRLKVITE